MSRSDGSRSFTRRVPIRTSPDVISSRPATMRRSVDFPQPEGPTSTAKAPSGMSSDTSRTAVTAPA
jgi:hypothetical protein